MDCSHSPRSLFRICLEYVTKNVDQVESLDNIPEVVGRQLLEACDCFLADTHTSQQCIRLFASAYGSDFMHSFSCAADLRLLSEFADSLIELLCPVSNLDLSNCNFGNYDDILNSLVKFGNLKVLNIANNNISENGFRTMLARHRMFKEGFACLETLDVSGNVVSIRTLKTVLGFPKLVILRVTIASTLKLNEPRFLKNWTASTKLEGFFTLSEDGPVANDIEIEGFGASIVDKWKKVVAKTEKEKEIRNDSFNFYCKPRKFSNITPARYSVFSNNGETYTYQRSVEPSCDRQSPAAVCTRWQYSHAGRGVKLGQRDREVEVELIEGARKKQRREEEAALIALYQPI